jgi:hypothetical protein
MLSTELPTKTQVEFAHSGVKNIIPVPSQQGTANGAASFEDGFPPQTMQPISAGGARPFGQDFNGILHHITRLTRWYSAGGPITYDATFAAAVGGYPKGAVVRHKTVIDRHWVNQVDGNTTDPESGGTNWNLQSASEDLIADYIARIAAEASARATAVANETSARATAEANIVNTFNNYYPKNTFWGHNTSGNGHIQMPNLFFGNVFLQFGQYATTSGSGDLFNWPIAFPTAFLAGIVCEAQAGGWLQGGIWEPTIYGINTGNAAQFRVSAARVIPGGVAVGPSAFFVIAVGY